MNALEPFGILPEVLAIVIGAGLVALAAVTGVLAADCLTPGLSNLERRVLGLIAGFGLFTVASYLTAMAGALGLAPVFLGLLAALFLAWRILGPSRRPITLSPLVRRFSGRDSGAPMRTVGFELQYPGRSTLVAVSLLLTFTAFALPVLMRPMPQGWDPAFHSAIIDSIRRLGELPATWGPYEPGEKFNYPAALHAALALFSRSTGVPADFTFTLALIAVGGLMLLGVFALGVRFGGGAKAGVLAVFVYGLGDGWGTLASHAAWGGLPNLAGLVLMSGFVLAVAKPSAGSTALAAVLAAAIALTHHLSFALLGFSFALLLLLELVCERRLSPVGKAALVALGLAVATAGVLVLARPTGRFDLAHAFRFERERITDLLKAWEVMGPVLLAGGGIGLVASLFTHKEPGLRLLPAWAIGLLGFWVAWDMVYRAAVWWIAHGRWTALTPSRGLTDAAVPLAVCLAALIARGLASMSRTPAWASVVAVGIILAGLGFKGERDRLRDARAGAAAFADARAMCREVKARTSADAVLFAPNAGEVGIWLPYLCERELNYFPDPGYYQSPYRETKMRIQDPRELARFIATQQGQRPVYFATRGRSSLPLVVSVSGWNLYRVEP